jgi:hypothetical protein
LTADATHLVLIPSYNTGVRVLQVVREAQRFWSPVWVVVDGSTDGTGDALARLAATNPGLRVFLRARNGGKGAAVLDGLLSAEATGFTHVLIMDADGQHPAESVPDFMALSRAHPEAMILGVPVFDATAPRLRVAGRRISNWWTNLETLRGGIADSLFGFRVYPIARLRSVMEATRWMRRYDFDAEAVVRLSWDHVAAINQPARVKYFRPDQDGVSHFRYLRDNALLTWMHLRLVLGFMRRLPRLARRRLRSFRH